MYREGGRMSNQLESKETAMETWDLFLLLGVPAVPHFLGELVTPYNHKRPSNHQNQVTTPLFLQLSTSMSLGKSSKSCTLFMELRYRVDWESRSLRFRVVTEPRALNSRACLGLRAGLRV